MSFRSDEDVLKEFAISPEDLELLQENSDIFSAFAKSGADGIKAIQEKQNLVNLYGPEADRKCREIIPALFKEAGLEASDKGLIFELATRIKNRGKILTALESMRREISPSEKQHQMLQRVKLFFENKTVERTSDIFKNGKMQTDKIAVQKILDTLPGYDIVSLLKETPKADRSVKMIWDTRSAIRMKLDSELQAQAKECWFDRATKINPNELERFEKIYRIHAAKQYPLLYFADQAFKQYLPDKKAYTRSDLEEYIKLFD